MRTGSHLGSDSLFPEVHQKWPFINIFETSDFQQLLRKSSKVLLRFAVAWDSNPIDKQNAYAPPN